MKSFKRIVAVAIGVCFVIKCILIALFDLIRYGSLEKAWRAEARKRAQAHRHMLLHIIATTPRISFFCVKEMTRYSQLIKQLENSDEMHIERVQWLLKQTHAAFEEILAKAEALPEDLEKKMISIAE